MNKFYIDKVTLENYKKYEEETFELKLPFTLLVGKNSTGKTSVLDGIVTSVGGFLAYFSGIKGSETHSIGTNDLHMSFRRTPNGFEKLVSDYTKISGEYNINEEEFSWNRYRHGIKSRTLMKKSESEELYKLTKKMEKSLKSDETVLPVFSYHGTGRLWEQEWKQSSKMENLQRVDAYKDCLNAKSNYRNFIIWFAKLSRMAYEFKEENPLLEGIKDVIKRTLYVLTGKNIDYIGYMDNDLIIKFKESDLYEKVGLMSDGYKNIIGMVSDIAYRIAILNPNLEDNIKNTPGIVLIDEIDLHLHPKWQRVIVDLLIELFPKVQFIATSHSPFIIQSMEAGKIIDLDRNENLLTNAIKMSIEDIAEDIMGVEQPQMSHRKEEMLEVATEYFDILDKLEEGQASPEEVEDLKDKLDELSEPFEENMAYVAFLKRKRLLAEKRLEQKNETSK